MINSACGSIGRRPRNSDKVLRAWTQSSSSPASFSLVSLLSRVSPSWLIWTGHAAQLPVLGCRSGSHGRPALRCQSPSSHLPFFCCRYPRPGGPHSVRSSCSSLSSPESGTTCVRAEPRIAIASAKSTPNRSALPRSRGMGPSLPSRQSLFCSAGMMPGRA